MKNQIQVDEMAHQGRMLDDLSSILGNHTVEKVNNFCKVFSDLHMCTVTGILK